MAKIVRPRARQGGKKGTTEANLRWFTKHIQRLWESGDIKSPVHFCSGNESELVSIFKSIKKSDYVFSTHRNMYHSLLKTKSPNKIDLEIQGSAAGICGGNARSMNISSRKHNLFSTAIVAGNCAIATGVAEALQRDKSKKWVWCFIGDGSTDNGHFWEAAVYAFTHDLPITFILEDNDRSTCTNKQERLGNTDRWYSLITALRSKVFTYQYKPDLPHVGTGVYVSF